MYLFFAILLTFVFLILTVFAETGRGRKHLRLLFFVNLALASGGVLLLAGTFFAAKSAITGGGFDEEFVGWAWDMFTVFFRLSLIPTAVFLVVALLACLVAVFDRKQRTGFSLKLRLSALLLFSIIPLLLAPMYSFLTVNESVALDSYILLTGIAEALLLRAPLLIEYGRRMRTVTTM